MRPAQPLAMLAQGQCLSRQALGRCMSSAARPMSEIPGPTRWPLLGTIPDFIKRSGGNLSNADVTAIQTSYYREFGNIYQLKSPPFGNHVVVCDPREYLQIYQMEGKYPPGASEYAWPFMHYHEKVGNHTINKIMSNGEPWHDYRHGLAKDIFGPPVAREYLPAISEAARLASASALGYEDRFDEFVSRLAFDMFCALAVGKQAQTTNTAVADPADLQFVTDSVRAFEKAGQLLFEPHSKFIPGGGKLPAFMKHMGAAQHRGEEVVEALWSSLDEGQCKGLENSSYMARLVRRGKFSKAELSESLIALLMAGVDTTSYVTAWLLLNLAKHPAKQEILREELASVLQGGDLVEEFIGKLPYLKACIRESHRYTPPGPFGGIRKLPKTAVFCGYEIPKGTAVILNTVAFTQDPKYLPKAQDFCPERWLSDEVKRRGQEGGEVSVVDHRLLAAPFGHGARMCLGARVAILEIQAATCRLIQDYRLELEPDQTWTIKQGLFTKADPFPKFKITRL